MFNDGLMSPCCLLLHFLGKQDLGTDDLTTGCHTIMPANIADAAQG